jgi:nitrogen-specific signal transduction histidine kinase/CheY-like chemotaxis protein
MHERRFAANAHQLERASAQLKRDVAARTEALLNAQAAVASHQRLAGLGRLTAGVAHEINNPLSIVRDDLERLSTLADAGVDVRGEARHYIEHATDATNRIVRIVRRLLEAGRAATSEAADVEPFLMAPIVRETLAAIGHTLELPLVVVDVDDRLAAVGNVRMIAQVLEHLVTNAAQALEGRTFNTTIHVRAQRIGDRMQLVVGDNGPGIPEHVRERMFEPFVSTKGDIAHGLGLAVSLGLMRSQKGSLALVQTSSSGTEMALELPWAPFDYVLRAPDGTIVPPHDDGRTALLVIDDNQDILTAVSRTARDRFDVVAVGSVAEAAVRLESGWRPDVVLCDLIMPDGGAATWLTLCGTQYPSLTSRTIIITAGPTTPEEFALVSEHANRVLFKPFTFADMQRLVTRVMR